LPSKGKLGIYARQQRLSGKWSGKTNA